MHRSIRRAKAKKRERLIYLGITSIALGIAGVLRLTTNLALELRILLVGLIVVMLIAGVVIIAKKFK